MGNRVSNLWCKKTNLAIKDKEFNENTKVKRESKRRFKQRRLSLNCITREPNAKPNEEPVLVHKPSSTLPRHTKLSTPEKQTQQSNSQAEDQQNPDLEKESQETKNQEKVSEILESPKSNNLKLSEESSTVVSNSTTASPSLKTPKEFTTSPISPHENIKPVWSTNSIFNTNSFGSLNTNLEQKRFNSFSPKTISSLSSSPSRTPSTNCSNSTIDVVDSPIRVLATTKTQDILTREKLTCTTSSISSLKTAMKFNTDLTTVKVRETD